MQNEKQHDNVQISKELAETIINFLEGMMYNEWYNAVTVLTEEEYKEKYCDVENEIISEIKSAIAG